MILIGQYDSPYVRRVGIAMRRLGVEYEHRPWSVWGDADKIRAYNPLCRVPVLVLDDGTVLTESFVIIDTIDDLVGPERALMPRGGAGRREALRIAALCTGICDKAVNLLYVALDLMQPSPRWRERCWRQMGDTLSALEKDRSARPTSYWLGESLTHADIAFACAFRFVREAHPSGQPSGQPSGIDVTALYPALTAHAARCEALAEFQAVSLPITNRL